MRRARWFCMKSIRRVLFAARFIRVARERGYCRTLHERHSQAEVALNIAIAAIRLTLARALNASLVRIAREERRLAVAQGMRDGLMRTGK